MRWDIFGIKSMMRQFDLVDIRGGLNKQHVDCFVRNTCFSFIIIFVNSQIFTLFSKWRPPLSLMWIELY